METDAETLPAADSASIRGGWERAPGLSRGATIGRYCILEEVGRGAMGVVYAAYDPKLDRKVAIKVLLERADNNAVVDMISEAQALARVNHPNVVHVYDVDEHEQRVFMAMEFVVGQSVRDWSRATERSRDEVLDVFAKAATGLAAVHAAGVVHRDVKPDNLMIADTGRVLVMDFGLAVRRPTDADPESAIATHTAGTPAYMSPEQLRSLPLQAASDQFSFCVALFEALDGERPFDGDNLADLTSAVLAGRFSKSPPLRGNPPWLRRLVLRGLASEPGDRHASMEAITDEITRARLRPRKIGFMAGAGVLAALAIGAVRHGDVGETQCRDAAQGLTTNWAEGWKPEIRKALVARLTPAGEAIAAQVETSMDAYAQRWRSEYDGLCSAAFVEGRLDGRERDTRTQCLDHQHEYMASLMESPVEATDAALWGVVVAASSLPDPAECGASSPPSADDSNERSLRIANAQRTMAHARGRAAVGDHARVLHDVALAIEALADANDPILRAQLLKMLSDAQYELGDLDAGREAMSRALRQASRGGDSRLLADLWLDRVRQVLASERQPARAQYLLEAAEVAVAAVPDDPLLASRLHSTRGALALDQARYSDARDAFQQAVADAERGQPTVVHRATRLAELAHAQSRLGMGTAALATQRAAYALLVDAFGEGHPQAIVELNNIAVTCQLLADEACIRQSAQKALSLLGPSLPDRAKPLLYLGQLEFDQGNMDAADRLAREALAIRIAQDGELFPATTGARLLLFNVLRRQGRHDEALQQARALKTIKDETTESGHPARAIGLGTLGRALQSVGQLDEAEAALREALAIRERALEPGDLRIGYSSVALADLLLATDQLTEASVHAARSVALLDAANATNPWRAEARFLHARAVAQSDPERAAALARESLRLYEDAGERSSAEREAVRAWLAR